MNATAENGDLRGRAIIGERDEVSLESTSRIAKKMNNMTILFSVGLSARLNVIYSASLQVSSMGSCC